jgi:excisionase family DNA binding protein
MLTTAQVAKRLSSKAETIAKWRRKGYGPPFVRIGRTVRYLAVDVEEWINSRI